MFEVIAVGLITVVLLMIRGTLVELVRESRRYRNSKRFELQARLELIILKRCQLDKMPYVENETAKYYQELAVDLDQLIGEIEKC